MYERKSAYSHQTIPLVLAYLPILDATTGVYFLKNNVFTNTCKMSDRAVRLIFS